VSSVHRGGRGGGDDDRWRVWWGCYLDRGWQTGLVVWCRDGVEDGSIEDGAKEGRGHTVKNITDVA
jgi:hypothetical protein